MMLCLIFLSLIISSALENLMPSVRLFSYVDDIITLFLLFPSISIILNKCHNHSFYLIVLLILICIIGVASNIIAHIVTKPSYILQDMYSFLKMFIMYLGTYHILSEDRNRINRLLKYLLTPAKVFILLSSVFGLLNLFGIVNMAEYIRYGFPTYSFVIGNASQFGVFLGCCLAILIFSKKRTKIYEFLAILTMILTMKGMSFILVGCYLGLNFYIHNRKKIRIWHFIILALVLLYVLQYQITGYLLDTAAPRAMLIKYGFITANNNFPLGAGFGAYGSNIAAVHYSPLYSLYGFTSRASLIYGEKTALNDCYIGMIIGQFGYIGLICFLSIMAIIGKKLINNSAIDYKSRNIAIASFICICGMCVMAGSVKANPGQLLFMIVAIYVADNERAADSIKIE